MKNVVTPESALAFMLAGRAVFTLRSAKSGDRYTYKISRHKDKPNFYFVKLLTGPSNTSDFEYIGVIEDGQFLLKGRTKMTKESLPVLSLVYTLKRLNLGHELTVVEIWHEGACGRCGRPLTVPESLQTGLGPVCAKGGTGTDA